MRTNDNKSTNDTMKPSELAKANGLASLREVSRMVNRSEAILYTWGRERPELLEAIIIGCAVIKRHREREAEGAKSSAESSTKSTTKSTV